MTWLVVLATGIFAFLQTTPGDQTPPPQDGGRLTRSVDERAASRCRGSLYGFSNVQVRCAVGADGSLEQCEVLSENPDVIRRRDRFICMAEAVTVHDATGAPVAGRFVTITFHGPQLFEREPTDDSEKR